MSNDEFNPNLSSATTKSYYASSVATFLHEPTEAIVGKLAIRVGSEHSGNEAAQIGAWRTQVDLLKSSLSEFDLNEWGILLEMPLLRLGRRIDAIILIGDYVACIEFKVGAARFGNSDANQAVDYALCLRDFHGGSRGHRIIPILCADQAPAERQVAEISILDGVAKCLHVNGSGLAPALRSIAQLSDAGQIAWADYDASSYNPTPDIVTAAKGLYAGHSVREIGRADAPAEALERTANRLRHIIEQARKRGDKVVCFVTGEPGSGKTLLGLDLVLSGSAGRVAGEPSALLSGNRPLVYVLQAAMAEDARARLGVKASEAKRQAQQALQTLLGYLRDHLEPDSNPPEHVIVFDEAQRAWNAETGMKLLGRASSEPELFLEIMGRLPWAALVCLVGPGQEINRGEGGLALWGEALASNLQWKTYVSSEAMKGHSGMSGLTDSLLGHAIQVEIEPELHLTTNLRAYRNSLHGNWVSALLTSDIEAAAAIASDMEHPPALLTRDLNVMKNWLAARRRGEQRVGLLASSGAVRLIADGIPSSPRSNELDQVVHWFLRPADDFRSSSVLEVPLSEFVCQGLEIDYAGLCWGNDLIWSDGVWTPQKMRAPKWQKLNKTETRQYRINSYRVLLTRARAGTIIFVPRGNENDPTRRPADFDDVFDVLQKSGCAVM
tara:strand:+ start:34176 stop:36176 length:2001 start_codon:yes stop_codon:yes gene_type:complete